jgi:putative tricarboxylic transport membrane protein
MRSFRAITVLVGAVTCAGLMSTSCSGPGAASADGPWNPTGDMTMVVPFKAGGGSDLSGRAMAGGLEKTGTDLTFKVENRDGGSGAVGYSYFLTKKGDPKYVLATETALLALPLTQQVKFDYTSFTPIMKIGEDFTLAVAPMNSPLKTCADLVGKAESGRVVAGISGKTGLDNIVFTLTEQQSGVKFDRVPFESGAELMAALLGGQVEVASLNPGEVIGQLKSGKLKALCAFAEKRYDYPELAEIPTAKEQGIDVTFAQFRGLLAPGGLTDAEQQGWVKAAEAFAQSPEYDAYVKSNYLQPTKAFGAEFGEYLAGNNELLTKVLKP